MKINLKKSDKMTNSKKGTKNLKASCENKCEKIIINKILFKKNVEINEKSKKKINNWKISACSKS